METTFQQVLETVPEITNPEDYDCTMKDDGRFKLNLEVRNLKTSQFEQRTIDLRELGGETIMNIAAQMAKKLATTKPEKGEFNIKKKPNSPEQFLKLAEQQGWRIVKEFQASDGNQWIVYLVQEPPVPQRGDVPEPDYWVTGDMLDWQPGYQFNGSRWLVQKITLDDQERLVIQNVVHHDIEANGYEHTKMRSPFTVISRLVPEPLYNSSWRLYQDVDGKYKHWVDVVLGAHDRYYFAEAVLYPVTSEEVTDKGEKKGLLKNL